MLNILVALNFQRDMVIFFEETAKWHGMHGCFGERTGVRSMELHTLWFEFACLWWNGLIKEPEFLNFKETFASIDRFGDE